MTRVLVIDDEPPIRKLLRMGLSTQGYDILEASNGKIALEKLAESPSLIILDLGLPDIQGHDLLRMIRDRDESVPIVVLSSRGDEAGKVQALDLGADDYLTKPFGIATIKEYALEDCGTLEATQMGLESRVVSTFPLGDQEFMCRHANRVIENWVEDYKRKRAEG